MPHITLKIQRAFLAVAFLQHTSLAHAEIPPLRTNEPLYQNPFDLAAGGASITRATQDAVIFSNPSLAAFGAGFLRSIYFRNALHTNQETAQIAQKVQSGQVAINSDFLEKAIQTPYHLGLDISAGFITSKVNIGILSSTRIDIQGREFGTTGMPELRIRSYSLAAVPIGGSTQFRDVLAVGFALKPVYLAEVSENLGLDTILAASGSSLNETVKAKVKRGYGVSSDAAITLQLRSKHIDGRLAFVASDISGTTFVGGPNPWKSTLSAGAGIAVHTRDSVIHCAADIRDLEESYKEHWTKRFYTGCKAVSARQIGIAAGLYQGSPTFGGLVNLFIFRLEAGTYTREMGSTLGTNTRRLFFVAIGSEIP